jgi:hypothetical protein
VLKNLLWGAPRIHGELLKLGFAVAQSTVAKYMAGKADPSGQRWSTFLRNHSPQIAAMDLFVVPALGFNLLYVLVIVRLARRELVWLNVTAHPTANGLRNKFLKHSPGLMRHATWSAIGTRSTVLPSRAVYEPWASATSPLPLARRGRTHLPRG